jgi:cysteine synthase
MNFQACTKTFFLLPFTAIAKAEEIVSQLGSDAMLLQQFNNPDNPKVE